MYYTVCLFTPQAFAGYSFQPATEGGLRLSRPGCLVLHRGGLPVQRWSLTQAVTVPSMKSLRSSSPKCYHYTKPATPATGDGSPGLSCRNGVLGGTGTYSVPLRALTPSRVWGFQAPEIVGGQGRRGPHV